MTWVTVQSHDIGDTFSGIYALERVFGVGARMRFVLAIKSKSEAFASVCARFGISRKSGYKWWQRYRAGGVKALAVVRVGRILEGKQRLVCGIGWTKCAERIRVGEQKSCGGGCKRLFLERGASRR